MELTFDQLRLWATELAAHQPEIWRKAGRTCILMVALPDGRCSISAYETEAEALADKAIADSQLGEGHSIIRPVPTTNQPELSFSGVATRQETSTENHGIPENFHDAADDLPEGGILCAVIFDKHRKPSRTLVKTTQKEAWLQAGEMDCPIMVIFGMKFDHVTDTAIMPRTLFTGYCFAQSYGSPSERIKEQLVRQAQIELQAAFLEAGGGKARGVGQA